MINITELQKNELSKDINNLEELLNNGDLDKLLLAIDELFLSNLDENDEPTEKAMKYQRLYDQIYNQN
ncbi:Uncharacterised protein [Aedoeadaptatus ivorii]|uniref:Uncharacterized protein n=1 Tax=Aedoeadaptatus ivorii TaxID=54006 RepID=A0A3S4Y6L0_9FIRM|nr:hypothetical protein [Peptoniphilus ivorii]MDQ0508029.1 hypothetical protein [Peptoniphilus ivorii]VEJ34919.1 Uncharacterised protein [Peptoniphilus ivorii]